MRLQWLSVAYHSRFSFSQWLQDCLAYLLRLLSQFAVVPSDVDSQDEVFDLQESPTKKVRKHRVQEKLVVPRLNRVKPSKMFYHCFLYALSEFVKPLSSVAVKKGFPENSNKILTYIF